MPREKDVITLAERLLGWTIEPPDGDALHSCDYHADVDGERIVIDVGAAITDGWNRCWSPYTKIQDAWMLVEAIHATSDAQQNESGSQLWECFVMAFPNHESAKTPAVEWLLLESATEVCKIICAAALASLAGERG